MAMQSSNGDQTHKRNEMVKISNGHHNHSNVKNPRAIGMIRIVRNSVKSRVRRNVVSETIPSLLSRPMPKVTTISFPMTSNQPNEIDSAREDNEITVDEIFD